MTTVWSPEAVFSHYQELQQYVGWSDDDARRVRLAGDIAQSAFAALVDDFYRVIDAHPGAKAVITGGEAQKERLKGTLLNWLEQLFAGTYDAQYVHCRWNIGWRHVEIGLSQTYTNAALSRLRSGLAEALTRQWQGSADELKATLCSLHKLIDLDLAVMEYAYQAEYSKRQQHTERLAAIGQMSGGVAHELRNPLNVIKTSIYYLLNARNPSAEKTREHLERIERQVDAADAVTTALADFAKLTLPMVEAFALEPCLIEVLEMHQLPLDIALAIDIPPNLPKVRGDRRQLIIVFGNLIRNARDAMPKGGSLSLSAKSLGNRVSLTVADTGEGIPEEHLEKILEPLFSTKTRGIGLGLAISRAILEKHDARLDVRSRLGEGSAFIVELPAEILEQS